MTDLTNQLDKALESHNVRLRSHRRSLEQLADGFLKDAYKINAHLRELRVYLQQIRQPYLSTTAPPRHASLLARDSAAAATSSSRTHLTDTQRDAIDRDSRRALQDLHAGIRQLEEAERLRRAAEAQVATRRRGGAGFRALSRWAAGGTDDAATAGGAAAAPQTPEEAAEAGLCAHRANVLWYLDRQLADAAAAHKEMLQIRQQRELERNKSILYKTKDPAAGAPVSPVADGGGGHAAGPASPAGAKARAANERALADAARERPALPELTPEQIQLFEEENDDMLKHYDKALDQVRTAEKSIIEISELQTRLAANLELQATRIDQLAEDAANTSANVTSGNKELKKASERFRPAQYVFYATCGLSAFLVLWDLII